MKLISTILICGLTMAASASYGIEKKFLRALGLQALDQQAPDFTVMDADGRKINLKDSIGRVVIVHLWATWCEPCKEEFPLLEKTYQKFKTRDVVFLAIAIDKKAGREEITAFAKKLGASFPVYLAREADISDRYWTWGVPVSYFIDKKGRMVARSMGPLNADDLINALLEEK